MTIFFIASAPSIITAAFDTESKIRIYVGPRGAVHATLIDANGIIVRTRARAKEVLTDNVEIMPQVAPVERTEAVLSADHVRRNLSSILAPRHFRNQIRLLPECDSKFRALAEETWSGLQVKDLYIEGDEGAKQLSLFIRSDDFVAELASMGHGLQMWLQTMWFLARADVSSTIILDEPDVYMHPDLQRRLIRHLRQAKRQIVITTHSSEIMSEVTPEEILVLDRQNSRSNFATTFPAAQQVLQRIGSAHNLQLAKLWHARKSLLVEGEDFRLLSDFFNLIFPEDIDGLAVVPSMSIGGWSNWPYAIGSSMLLRNAGGDNISIYCILDTDFHTPAQKAARREEARRTGIRLHIWERKEIENYLLSATVIQRAITNKAAKRTKAPEISEIEAELGRAVDSLRDETFDAFSNEFLKDDRGLGPAGANKAARTYLSGRWTDLQTKLKIVSGKAVLKYMLRWSQSEFGVSLNPSLLARTFLVREVPSELRSVLEAISNRQEFPLVEDAY